MGSYCRSFRLDSQRISALQWLFRYSQQALSGIRSRGFEERIPSTDPEKLCHQEQVVDRALDPHGSDDVAREARLLSVASEMIRRDPSGAGRESWWMLKLAYGPFRRRERACREGHEPLASRGEHCGAGHKMLPDAFDEFGAELAPIVSLTPAARERALQGWARWYEEEFAEDYERIKLASRSPEWPASGGLLAAGRMMARVPSAPPGWQLEMVAEDAVARAVGAARNEALVAEMGKQADEILGEASRSFAEADDALSEARRETSRARREESRRAVERSVDQVAVLDSIIARLRCGSAA